MTKVQWHFRWWGMPFFFFFFSGPTLAFPAEILREDRFRLRSHCSLCLLQLLTVLDFPLPNQWLEYKKVDRLEGLGISPDSRPSVTGMSVWLPVYPDLAIKEAFFFVAGANYRYWVQTEFIFFNNALVREEFIYLCFLLMQVYLQKNNILSTVSRFMLSSASFPGWMRGGPDRTCTQFDAKLPHWRTHNLQHNLCTSCTTLCWVCEVLFSFKWKPQMGT